MTVPAASFVEQLTAWATLGTAIGTVGLAAATFVLARRTSAEVAAATQQAAASLDQVKSSEREAKAAEEALAVQTRPLLADVPWGVAQVVAQYVQKDRGAMGLLGPREAAYEDASPLEVVYDPNHKESTFSVPIRNVGNGTAIVQHVRVILSGNTGFDGLTSVPVLPPGEVTRVFLDVSDTSHGAGEARTAIEGRTNHEDRPCGDRPALLSERDCLTVAKSHRDDPRGGLAMECDSPWGEMGDLLDQAFDVVVAIEPNVIARSGVLREVRKTQSELKNARVLFRAQEGRG